VIAIVVHCNRILFLVSFYLISSQSFLYGMLGEKIVQVKGKVISQRVIYAEGPTMETTLSQSGNAKEMQVNETVTFVGRPTSSPGVLFAKGNGVLMATTA
jgi:hypothetical protein